MGQWEPSIVAQVAEAQRLPVLRGRRPRRITDSRRIERKPRGVRLRLKRSFAKCYALKGTGNWPNEFPHIIPLTGRSSVHQFIPKEFVCAIVLLMASALVVKSETVPLPRARPPILDDHTSAPKIESERSPASCSFPKLPNSNLCRRLPVLANAQQPMSSMSMQWSCRTIIGWSSLRW